MSHQLAAVQQTMRPRVMMLPRACAEQVELSICQPLLKLLFLVPADGVLSRDPLLEAAAPQNQSLQTYIRYIKIPRLQRCSVRRVKVARKVRKNILFLCETKTQP